MKSSSHRRVNSDQPYLRNDPMLNSTQFSHNNVLVDSGFEGRLSCGYRTTEDLTVFPKGFKVHFILNLEEKF